jgi:regulator of protease activity HflC (stomatin/prohibitin superfamily)
MLGKTGDGPETGKKGMFHRLRNVIMKLRAWFRRRIENNFPALVTSLLILLFVVVYFWSHIFISIHSGELGILYRRFHGGTVVDKVYGEGLVVIWPWDIMTIYNVRFQTKRYDLKVLTGKGLKITVYLSIRYRPETDVLGVLHLVVGPDYLDKIVIPEVEATIRDVMGQYDAEEIYTTKKGVIQRVVNESLAKVSQRFVKIDNVMITGVDLPAKIEAAIEAKLEIQQQAEAYEFKLEVARKEADRKLVEAMGIKNYNTTVDASLSDKVLTWQGVQATRELAKSANAKIVVIGGKDGLPVILNSGQ